MVKNSYVLIGYSNVLYLAIASALDCKIFVEARKHRILSQLQNDDLSKRLTTNPNDTNLHVVGMGSVTPPVKFVLRRNIVFNILNQRCYKLIWINIL